MVTFIFFFTVLINSFSIYLLKALCMTGPPRQLYFRSEQSTVPVIFAAVTFVISKCSTELMKEVYQIVEW